MSHTQPPPAEERAGRHVVGDRRILAKHRILDDAFPAVLHRIVDAKREVLPLADGLIVLRFGDCVILAGPPFDGVYKHFEWGNDWTLNELRKRFVEGPKDWDKVKEAMRKAQEKAGK